MRPTADAGGSAKEAAGTEGTGLYPLVLPGPDSASLLSTRAPQMGVGATLIYVL